MNDLSKYIEQGQTFLDESVEHAIHTFLQDPEGKFSATELPVEPDVEVSPLVEGGTVEGYAFTAPDGKVYSVSTIGSVTSKTTCRALVVLLMQKPSSPLSDSDKVGRTVLAQAVLARLLELQS